MRKTICRSSGLAVLVVGALAAPAAAAAQADTSAARADSAGTTHVVRRGDTLWDLAIEYLRNPFRWRDIHDANRAVVENPHWIYPGERIRIPARAAPADAVAADPVGAAAQPPATPAAPPATVGGLRVIGGIETPGRSFVVPRLDRLGDERSRLARRLADYLAAPYLDEVGGPAGAGVVRATGVRLASDAVGDRWLQLGDDVRLSLPSGVVPEIGQKLVTVALGDRVGGGQVVRPTGIVELTEFEGSRARGRVVVVLDVMRDGDGVLPLPALPTEGSGAAAGAGARVAWVQDDAPLPSLQSWLLLTPEPGASFAEQDEVRLYRIEPAAAGGDAERELLGTARIVRVSAGAASAIVTGVSQAGIAVGTRAEAHRSDAP